MALKTTFLLSAFAAAQLCVAGCGSVSGGQSRTPERTFHEQRVQPVRITDRAELEAGEGSLVLSDDIRKACGIETPASYFAYDSAQLRGGDHPLLTKLTECFATGPLKGKNLLFVGHCDSRGEHEYNLVLAERRAAIVKRFFTDRGLDAARIATSSRGYLDATGKDEASWALDRRVDIRLDN